LRKRGISINRTPLTVKEGRTVFNEAFQKASGQLAWPDDRSDGKPVIQAKNLWHIYTSGVTALKNVSLEIGEGEFVAIMGRNASGKTTLVKHFNRLLTPTKGSVKVDGIDTRVSSFRTPMTIFLPIPLRKRLPLL